MILSLGATDFAREMRLEDSLREVSARVTLPPNSTSNDGTERYVSYFLRAQFE